MRRWLLPLVLASSALAACGDGAVTPEQRTTEARTSTSVDHARPRPPAEPVLNRHDLPPQGVRRQIDFFGTGDQLCIPTGRPNVAFTLLPFMSQQTAPTYEPEIGQTLVLCVTDFRPDLAFEQTLKLPDGRVLRRTEPAGDQGTWMQFLDERWPTGRHVFTARQGEVVRRIAFRVLEPRLRGVRTDLDPVPAGGSLHVVLVGQRPHALVPIDVYRGGYTSTARYATTFEMRTDARGIGGRVLTLSSRDVGHYLLRPRTATARDGQDADAGVTVTDPPPPAPTVRSTGERPPTIFQASEDPPPGAPPTVDFLPIDHVLPGCAWSGEAGPNIVWMLGQPHAVEAPVHDDAPEIGDAYTLCAEDFPTTEPLQLAIVAPDGSRSGAQLPRPRGHDPTQSSYTRTFLPGDLLGTYRVTVSGGGASVQSAFTLRGPRQPGYRLLRDGARLSLLAIGLPPGQTVSVRVYRGTRTRSRSVEQASAQYAGQLPGRADADGVLRMPLRRDPAGDPAACYVFRLAYGAHVVPPGQSDATTVCLPLAGEASR